MFWTIVAVVVVVGLALAWWTSGRTKPSARNLTPGQHGENDAKAMRQYRPTDGGGMGGGGI